MPSATITSKGQVTIPKKIRDKLKLKTGDTVYFEMDSISTAQIKTATKDPKEIMGKYRHKSPKPAGLTVEEMDEGITEYFREKYKVR